MIRIKYLAFFLCLAQSAVFYAQTNDSKVKTEQTSDKPVKPSFEKPYDPKADAEKDIQNLILQAKKEKKNIMIQAGGNWCVWCLRFNDFAKKTPELKEILDKNYFFYHLNMSPENKNEKIFAQYGNPGEKFGYPVFIILDQNGKMIHIQDSEVLEEGKGYSIAKTKDFFEAWKPKN